MSTRTDLQISNRIIYRDDSIVVNKAEAVHLVPVAVLRRLLPEGWPCMHLEILHRCVFPGSVVKNYHRAWNDIAALGEVIVEPPLLVHAKKQLWHQRASETIFKVNNAIKLFSDATSLVYDQDTTRKAYHNKPIILFSCSLFERSIISRSTWRVQDEKLHRLLQV